MLIQINTGANVERNDELIRRTETHVTDAIDHFKEHITRVDVHLTDENSSKKGGTDDKRCLLEARLSGHPPVVVSHQAGTMDLAVTGAAEKLEHSLGSIVGRREKH
jgi:ribosome-associated translation inhibitor RaiA